jgi:WD40 repeat protein
LTGTTLLAAEDWEARLGALIQSADTVVFIISPAGHTSGVFAVAFSPDGKRALTGSFDNTARLWDATTGAPVATLEGHTGLVFGVAFSPDGKRALTGSFDDTARLWDAATGAAVAKLEGHTDSVHEVAFSPDGKRVLTGSDDKTARLWSVYSAQDLVDEVKASVPRCLTPDEREHSHLYNASPRWCHARNLWPYLDHGSPEIKGASPPYGPPPLTWDEKASELWDRWTSWLAPSERQSTRASEAAIKSP